MRYTLIILSLFLCLGASAQVYQSMPQAGYGPVKRMLVDSVLTIPIGISQLRNITGGRDTAQIRYQKSDSSVYVYTGSTWVKLGTGGGGGGSADSTVFFTKFRADTMRANIYARIVTTDSGTYFTKYRSDTMRANLYSYIKNVDSLTYFTKYRSDTMRANIYARIPQPDTFFVKYPVRVNNDTIYLAQTFVDSVYNVSAADATRLITNVYNNTGSTIPKGAVVYINGRHSSNLPTIALAQANDEVNSYKTFALVQDSIQTSSSGVAIQAGRINNLNLPTSSYADGDLLYLSPTVPGGYTTTKPIAPNHIVKLGSVTRAHPTFGGIEIKIENGWQLDELSDVSIPLVPDDSTLLQFSRVDSLWHDVSPVTALGNRTWRTGGNGNVNSNYFIGSTNNASLRFRTNNTETMVLDSIGRIQLKSFTNLGTVSNALQLANTNNRNFFNVSTTQDITTISFKANNNAVDSMVIVDSGLIQPRSNATLWLKTNATNTLNIVANRCSGCITTGSIFAANTGTSAPIFNVFGTGQVSIGAANPDASSALDITSTSRGLLIPRMSSSQRNAISSPASQLIVANTTDKTVDMYNGTSWNTIGGGYSDDLKALQLMGATIKTTAIGQPLLPVTGSSMTASRSYFSSVYLPREATITGASWYQSTQGVYVGTGGGYNGIGLYRDSSGTLILVDSTTRDTTIWKAASNTWQTKAFAGGTRTLQPGVYYLCAVVNTVSSTFPAGQTAPAIGNWSGPSGNSGTLTLLSNSRKIYGGVQTGVTALPTSQAMTAWNNLTNFYYSLYLY